MNLNHCQDVQRQRFAEKNERERITSAVDSAARPAAPPTIRGCNRGYMQGPEGHPRPQAVACPLLSGAVA